MAMRFEPTAALSALGRFGRTCFSLEDLGEFGEFMRSSPPSLALMSSEPGALDIHFGQV